MKQFKSVKEELLFLAERDKGFVNPHKVVEFAKDEKTHLHKQFEWDDSKAAQEFRLEQARKIIRLQLNVIETGDAAPIETRLFVSIQNDRKPGKGYRKLSSVLSEKDSRSALLEEAMAELARFRRKYRDLVELAEVFTAIENLQPVNEEV